jgi:hypothetical protein
MRLRLAFAAIVRHVRAYEAMGETSRTRPNRIDGFKRPNIGLMA